VHKYAKMMNIENYEVKEVIEITRWWQLKTKPKN
jgi:hypothetical protein